VKTQILTFLIIEENQEKAGCCSAWVEGANGMSSWFIKSNLLATFIPNENLQKAANKSKLLSQVYIERTLGAIQIEAVYVRKKFRGKGYSKILITEQARNLKTKNNNLSNIELIVASNNTIAIKTYEKIGFSKTIEKKCNNKKILQYLPSDTIFLMKADIQKIIKI